MLVVVQEMVYQVCLETGASGSDASHLFSNFPDLLGDRYFTHHVLFGIVHVCMQFALHYCTCMSAVCLTCCLVLYMCVVCLACCIVACSVRLHVIQPTVNRAVKYVAISPLPLLSPDL